MGILSIHVGETDSHRLDRELEHLSPNELVLSDKEAFVQIEAIESEFNVPVTFKHILSLQDTLGLSTLTTYWPTRASSAGSMDCFTDGN